MLLHCSLTYLRYLLETIMKTIEIIHCILHLYLVIPGFSLPGSTWDAGRKQTKMEMENIQEAHMFLYSENAFRGGMLGIWEQAKWLQ